MGRRGHDPRERGGLTDANTAFERAREMIAEAKRAGWDVLDFDRGETRALTRLPDEISELEGLRVLGLDNTDISDLTPLAGLTGLTRLSLSGTAIPTSPRSLR